MQPSSSSTPPTPSSSSSSSFAVLSRPTKIAIPPSPLQQQQQQYSQTGSPLTGPAVAPAPPPTPLEIERKLSLRSASPGNNTGSSLAGKPIRRPSNPTTPGAGSGNFSSSYGGTNTSTSYFSGNESDSSYGSRPGASSLARRGSGASPVLDATHGTTSGFSGSHSSGLLQPVAISTSGTGGLSAIAERRSLDDSAAQGQLSEEDLDEEEMDMFEADVAAAGQTGPAGGEPDAEDDSDEERVGGLAKGLENERTLKSGYLLKKGERRKAWKKRWFVLRTARLAYYKDHREYVLCRIIPLRDVRACVPVQLKKYSHCLGIVTAKRTYYIRAGSSTEADQWALAINEARKALADEAEEEETRRRLKEQQQQHGLGIGLPVTPQGGSAANSRQPSRTTTMVPVAASYAPQSGATAVARASEPLDVALDKMQLADDPNQPSPGSGSDGGLAAGSIPGPQRVSRPSPLRTTSSAREPSASSISTAEGRVVGGTISEEIPAAGLSSSDEEDAAFDSEQPATPGGMASPASAVQMQGTPIQSDPDRVILNGYLMKLGVKRKVWRKRWFVLTSSALMYTKSHMESRSHRSIPLRIIVDALEADDDERMASDSDSDVGASTGASAVKRRVSNTRGPHHHHQHGGRDSKSAAVSNVFQVVTPKRTFRLCAPTEEEEIKWVAALRALVNRERGGGVPMSPISRQPPRLPGVAATTPSQQQQQQAPPVIFAQPPTPASSIASAGPSVRNQPGVGGAATPRSPVTSTSPSTSTVPDQGYFASAQMQASSVPPPSAPASTTAAQSSGHPLSLGPVVGTGTTTTSESHSAYGQPTSPGGSTSPSTSGPPPINDTIPPLITHSSHTSSATSGSTHQRARSATQTARMAVADVVRRFNPPGSGSGSGAGASAGTGGGAQSTSQAQST